MKCPGCGVEVSGDTDMQDAEQRGHFDGSACIEILRAMFEAECAATSRLVGALAVCENRLHNQGGLPPVTHELNMNAAAGARAAIAYARSMRSGAVTSLRGRAGVAHNRAIAAAAREMAKFLPGSKQFTDASNVLVDAINAEEEYIESLRASGRGQDG